MGLRGDVTPVLDACYAARDDDTRWAEDVVGAFAEAFPFLENVTLSVSRVDAIRQQLAPMVAVGNHGIAAGFFEFARRFDLRELRAHMDPTRILSMWTEQRVAPAERCMSVDDRERAQELRRNAGCPTGLGLQVHPSPDVYLVVIAATKGALPRAKRTVLMRVALHLDSAFRLRCNAGRVRATLTSRGQLLDGARLPASLRERSAAATRGAETTRSTRDLSLWTALVAGELSVVPRMRGSRRVYELVENPRVARPFHALTRREADVLELSAKGLSSKLCSYALGLSASTISTTLANAALKIGNVSRLELVRIAALLAGDPRAAVDAPRLTRAEREILELVREGLSNAEIAARRGRSVRTIANQVAMLLDKAGASTRRGLIGSNP